MSDWTMVNVAEIVTFLGGLIAGLTYLNKTLKKWLAEVFKAQFDLIDRRFDEIEDGIRKRDKEATKNYLVQFISEVKRGEIISDTEKQRFYEQYEHYIAIDGNSYIKAEVEALKAKGYI